MGALDPHPGGGRHAGNRGPGRVSPFFVPMMLADTPAALISITHGLDRAESGRLHRLRHGQ